MTLAPEFGEQSPVPRRCWAYGPQGRCELVGGHSDDHQIIQTWTDEECLDPATYVPLVSLPIHDAVLVDQAVPEGLCFSCSCTKEAHLEVGEDGEQMCARHQCRTWIA